MPVRRAFILVSLITMIAGLPACVRSSADALPERPPAKVEPIEGSDVARVTLSADAARRLDIQTVSVRAFRHGDRRQIRPAIPYAAVLYDASGRTWTYTTPQPLVFVRSPVVIERIVGDEAFLSYGPKIGTEVVTVGAAELWGAENEVGEE